MGIVATTTATSAEISRRIRWVRYQIRAVAKCPELTRAGKAAMLGGKLRYHTGLLRRDQVVDCGVARIRLGRESFATDWRVFFEVFVSRIYDDMRFDRASVIDLGGHKGYFGVFALSRGAARVVSYEPEPMNFGRLAAAAQTVPEWTVFQAAVAGTSGVRSLSIKEAWSHTLLDDETEGEVVAVQAISLTDVLAEHSGERQVVKLDIEGAECEALARASSALLARVDELMVEPHPEAGCDRAAILAIATTAGLRPVDGRSPLMHFVSAPGT
jgi:FkbM family methyltransferase